MSLMSKILGNRYTDISTSDLLVGGRADTQKKLCGKLIDKTLAVADETSIGDKLKLRLIKKLTGINNDSVVNCKKLYADQCDRHMYYKLLLLTNDLPEFDSSDSAFLRRLIVVSFDRYFRNIEDEDFDPSDALCGIRDDQLYETIKQENIFFKWLIQGAKLYYQTPLNENVLRGNILCNSTCN